MSDAAPLGVMRGRGRIPFAHLRLPPAGYVAICPPDCPGVARELGGEVDLSVPVLDRLGIVRDIGRAGGGR
jgi:hypothetical protein